MTTAAAQTPPNGLEGELECKTKHDKVPSRIGFRTNIGSRKGNLQDVNNEILVENVFNLSYFVVLLIV